MQQEPRACEVTHRRVPLVPALERAGLSAAQDVLANLGVSAIEFRAEDDPDLAAHTHAKRIELRTVSPSREARPSSFT